MVFKIGTTLVLEDLDFEIVEIEIDQNGKEWFLIDGEFGSHWGTERMLTAKLENDGWGA